MLCQGQGELVWGSGVENVVWVSKMCGRGDGWVCELEEELRFGEEQRQVQMSSKHGNFFRML